MGNTNHFSGDIMEYTDYAISKALERIYDRIEEMINLEKVFSIYEKTGMIIQKT